MHPSRYPSHVRLRVAQMRRANPSLSEADAYHQVVQSLIPYRRNRLTAKPHVAHREGEAEALEFATALVNGDVNQPVVKPGGPATFVYETGKNFSQNANHGSQNEQGPPVRSAEDSQQHPPSLTPTAAQLIARRRARGASRG